MTRLRPLPVVCLLCLALGTPLRAQAPIAWEAIGRGPGGIGLSGRVADLAVTADELYAVGGFSAADGQIVNSVARWDGAAWHAVGGGAGGGAGYASTVLAAPGGDLYVAGSFTTAGGAPARGVARWDGAL